MRPASSRFDIGAVIGRGGNAIVFEAFDRWSGHYVALKVGAQDEVALARLEREGRAASAIRHPNVCATLDYGLLDDGHPFVAMELLRGETLRSYLAKRGRLDDEEVIELGAQLLAGLEAAHALHVVHRDIKPENIIIEWPSGVSGRDLQIKLIDFGVCRRGLDPIDERTLTLAGCVVGTPGYFAPEQAFGERALDPRVDIFAVGLVLFEALTGRAAYESHQTTELSAALTQPLPPLRAFGPVPRALERAVQIATAPSPEERYATAGRFLHDLLEARTELRREARRIAAAVLPASLEVPSSVGIERVVEARSVEARRSPPRGTRLVRAQLDVFHGFARGAHAR